MTLRYKVKRFFSSQFFPRHNTLNISPNSLFNILGKLVLFDRFRQGFFGGSKVSFILCGRLFFISAYGKLNNRKGFTKTFH